MWRVPVAVATAGLAGLAAVFVSFFRSTFAATAECALSSSIPSRSTWSGPWVSGTRRRAARST